MKVRLISAAILLPILLIVILALPEIVKDVVVILLTTILIWDFARSLREALDLRDQLKSLKEVWMKPGKHEGIEDKLEHIQAELTARYEVRIPFF